MIIYTLACGQGHSFEGWFASAEGCERQAAAGLLECPVCGDGEVRKLPSAPHVHTSGTDDPRKVQVDASLAAHQQALAAVRKFILEHTEDVGRSFAEVARRIHYAEEKARGIRGQVTPSEAADLREEGVAAYSVPPGALPGQGEVH